MTAVAWIPDLITALAGSLVGFSLGLIGGGGSILAVPLLIYVVGIRDAHIAIGTSALAVAANAFINLASHWRAGTVKWPCAITFGLTGMAGAAIGSSFGKLMDGEKLLFLFAIVMIGVAITMLRTRGGHGDPDVHLTPRIAVRLAGLGLLAGLLSGFFGIGGGFLIVPGIMLGSGMTILNAIGSSLFSVGTFGLTTAANYALASFVDWKIAMEFIAGGALGGFVGMKAALRLAAKKQTLSYIFAGVILAVALYMLAMTGAQLLD